MHKHLAALVIAGLAALAPVVAFADDTADFLAAFKHYPIELKPDPTFDASPYTFDFSKAKLTTRYDGFRCRFSMSRLDLKDQLAGGSIAFQADRIAFSGYWTRNGLATPQTFGDANVGVTDKGLLVGKMPVFTEYINVGDVPQDAIVTNLKVKKGSLGGDAPEGTLVFRVNDWIDAELTISGCRK